MEAEEILLVDVVLEVFEDEIELEMELDEADKVQLEFLLNNLHLEDNQGQVV